MNQNFTQLKVLKILQWLFRLAVVLSLLVSVLVNTGRPYQYLPKNLIYGGGNWFLWFSVPTLIGIFMVLMLGWFLLRKRYQIKPSMPLINLGFLLFYIVFWLVFRLFILKIGF